MPSQSQRVVANRERVSLQRSSSMSPTHGGSKPPVKPRTAFICFKDSKVPQISWTKDPDEIMKHISKEWNKLNKTERARWDEISREDKVRYGRENEDYKGPITVPKRRAKKDPLAPRRPMSAFLKFSQDSRKKIKEENPHLENTDISQLLGAIWKSAPMSDKDPYVEQEKVEREAYKERMRQYKSKKAQDDAAQRHSHQEIPAPRCSNTFDQYHDRDPQIFRSYSGSHPTENKGGYQQAYAQPVYPRHKVAPEALLFSEPLRPASPHLGYSAFLPENYSIKATPSDLSHPDLLLCQEEVATSSYFAHEPSGQRKRPEASCHFGGVEHYRP